MVNLGRNKVVLGLSVLVLVCLAVPVGAQALFIIRPPVFNATVSLESFVTPAGEDLEETALPAGEFLTARVRYREDFLRDPDYIKLCFIREGTAQCQQDTELDLVWTTPFSVSVVLDDVSFTLKEGQYQYYLEVGGSDSRLPGGVFTYTTPLAKVTVGSGSVNSSVLFLPGVQGSRLYQYEDGVEKRLWEPGADGAEPLYLNEQGESLTEGIYTRDIMDEVLGFNVYKKFSQFMDDLVADETLATWQPAPYDWRFGVEDQVPAVIAELEELAAADTNVTIIAHSYGGLIAKAAVQELQQREAAGEDTVLGNIERLILVASPQLGTPRALPGIMHGFDLELGRGALLNTAQGRALAKHMPSAFALLPYEGYFAKVIDPIVRFDSSADMFAPFSSLFGPTIDTADEMVNFATGGEGSWEQPYGGDTVSPLVALEHFLTTAREERDKLASWQPSEHMEVIQIAGWGLDTVKAMQYTAKRIFSCGDVSPQFCHDKQILDVEPVFTVDGDETVVSPSAVAMEGEEYYVHLVNHNRGLARLRRNRDHADILEVAPLQDFIQNIITDVSDLPDHIVTEKPPVDDADRRIRVSVHSPVSLSVCSTAPADDGRPLCTNSDKEDIANSYYLEFGKGKYIGFGTGEPHIVSLEGEGTGTFDLVLEEVVGETVVETVRYDDIPVNEGVEADLSLQTIEEASGLRLDVFGVPVELAPGEELTTVQLVGVLDKYLDGLRLKKGARKSTWAHVKNVRKFLRKHKHTRAIHSQLKNIVKKVEKEVGKSVTREEADSVAHIIEMIEVQLEL